MADIFVSWGSPDQKPIDRLLERLNALGLDYYDYRHLMPAGAEIPIEVLDKIHSARVALLCMSQETIGRDWLMRELHWCYADYVDDLRPMRRLIPVTVGETKLTDLPKLLTETSLHRFDLSHPDSFEADLERLVHDIQLALGDPIPRVVPATVVSVTQQGCKQLMENEARIAAFRELCLVAGMRLDDNWVNSCLARYGAKAEDLSPFSTADTVVDAVHRTIRDLNRSRKKEQQPVAIHWYSRELLTDHTEEGKLARRHWQNDAHLLIIDALSLLDERIRIDLSTIFGLTVNASRRALLWIPPYTQHTFRLQEMIRQVAETVVLLEAPFQDWMTRPERIIAFDTATPVALARWLNSALRKLTSPPPPIEENVVELTKAFPQPEVDPASWFKPKKPRSF